MATNSATPRRLKRPATVLAATLVAFSFAAAACGGDSDPTAAQAREVILAQLDGQGISDDIAECIADASLARFEPNELVNSSGEATAEVEAGVQEIALECATPDTTIPETTVPETTVPETTIPPTTVPETTVPETTVPDVDLTAFCVTSEDVYVALLAGDHFEDPAPATLDALFSELIDRTELAIVTAPNSDYTTQPNALLEALEAFDELLAEYDYVSDAVPQEEVEALSAEEDVIDQSTTDLEAFLVQCESTTDVDADATELAGRLVALGGDTPVGPIDGVTRRAESELFISSDVPTAWVSELSETVGDRRVFIVATDAESFKTSWAVDGVRISGIDATVDYFALMDDTDAFRECTLLAEEVYDDGLYTGTLRRYESCGESGTTEAVIIGANSTDSGVTVLVEFQMIEFDQAVLDMITSSFVA